jgi:hypothetical protein
MQKAQKGGLKEFLYDHSRLYRFFRYRVLATKQAKERKQAINAEGKELVALEKETSYLTKKEKFFFEIHQAYWKTVADSFSRLARVCKAHEIPAAIVIFPGLDDLVDYRYGSLHEKVSNEAGKNGLPVIDLADEFQKAKRLWPDWEIAIDFNHPNGEGHRLAGWSIATHLIDDGLLPLGKLEYNDSLFQFDLVRRQMDLEYFNEQDMYHVEQGLNRIFYDDTKGAVDSFAKALTINPENTLAKNMLAKIYGESDDEKIRQRIERLLN